MSRSSWTWGTLFAAVLVLGLTAERSAAQTVIVGAPPTSYAAPLAVSYYAAPAVSYYTAPTVSYYTAPPAVSYYAAPAVSYYAAPAVSYYAPAVSYYTPAPIAVTTVRPGILPRREIVRTRYYASAPVATYAPAAVAAPSVAGYYSPVYLYP
jgi:hypothetical protein